ncbi:MAG TPA: hypothetical protein VNA25_03370 [Phycisphaerae bacterium]|nr:hypothetical protein [Phycisphaerae bacterium]
MKTETFTFTFEGNSFEARVLTWREETVSRKTRASELMHGRLRDVHFVYQNIALIRATLEFAVTKWPQTNDGGPGNFDTYFGGWTVADDAKNIVIEVNGKTYTFRPLSWWEEFVTKVAFAATLASDEGGTLADLDREAEAILECQALLELAAVSWPKDCQGFHDSFSSQTELLHVTNAYQKALQDVENVRCKRDDARSAERMADRIITLWKAYEVGAKPFRPDESLVSGDDAGGSPEPGA